MGKRLFDALTIGNAVDLEHAFFSEKRELRGGAAESVGDRGPGARRGRAKGEDAVRTCAVEFVQVFVERPTVGERIRFGGDRKDRTHRQTREKFRGGHDGDALVGELGSTCEERRLVVKFKLRAGSVVALQTSRSARRVLPRVGDRKAQGFLEHFARHDAVAQDRGHAVREVHHRRLDPEFAGTAVENHVEFSFGLEAEVFGDVRRRRRTDASEGVRRRRREALMRLAREAFKQRVRDRMRGAAKRHRVLTARHEGAAAFALFENDREGAGPIGLDE